MTHSKLVHSSHTAPLVPHASAMPSGSQSSLAASQDPLAARQTVESDQSSVSAGTCQSRFSSIQEALELHGSSSEQHFRVAAVSRFAIQRASLNELVAAHRQENFLYRQGVTQTVIVRRIIYIRYPTRPTPAKPRQVNPTPVKPTQVNPAPVKPTQVNPTQVNPTPVKPAPVTPPSVPSDSGANRQEKLDLIRSKIPDPYKPTLDLLGGKLDDRDLKTGKTLLDNLFEIAKNGVDSTLQAHGVTTEKIVGGLVLEIGDAGNICQGNHGTCGATSVEYLMATNYPAEFARLVGQLANGGRATMANGGSLTRVADSIANENSGRTAVDRLFQSAAMNNSEMGAYSDRTDTHASGGGGLTQDDVTNLVEGMSKVDYRTVYGNDAGVLALIQRATQQGQEVPVGLNWAGAGGHELLVTKMENGQVYLRNPWGSNETGSPFNGPQRQLLDNKGNVVMTQAEFQRYLISSSVPA